MEELLSDNGLQDSEKCHLHFALSKAYEDLDDLTTSYSHLKTGNALRKKVLKYDFSEDVQAFENIKLNTQNIKKVISSFDTDAPPKPIFILGMMRLGTTLVEQIVSRHSRVTGAGELGYLGRFGYDLAIGLKAATSENIKTLRDSYLTSLQQRNENTEFITDKMPVNFKFINLIKTALPEAKIIHVHRDPKATCWSNFKHYFSSNAHGFCYDLNDTVQYYKLYEDLMNFWRLEFPNSFYDLDYETLVTNQVQETKFLMDYLGLDFEDACLEPHKNIRSVQTASQQQVRERSTQIVQKHGKNTRALSAILLICFKVNLICCENTMTEHKISEVLKMAVDAHKAGDIQKLTSITAILKAQPKHPDANHNIGVLAVGVGKVQEAIPYFKTALEANPAVSQFWLSYIDALIKLNRIADAKAVFDQAKSKGAKGEGFDQLAKQLSLSEETTTSINEPTKNNLKVLYSLYSQGHYREVLDQALQLLLDFPNSFTLYNIVGAANKGLDRPNEAAEAYNKAISIKPDFAQAHNNLGNALKDQNMLQEAIKAYRKAVSVNPNYSAAFNNLGNALKDENKLEEAIEAYKKALSIEPNLAEAVYNMGLAFKEQGEREKSIKTFERVIKIDPSNRSAEHILNSLRGDKPKTAPREYVERLFDGYADRFEKTLVGDLEYKIPKLITNVLLKMHSNNSLGSVLDLGCGTGLMGSEINGYCKELVGIDLSSKMLKHAKKKTITLN